jgi:anti-sigma factor RsiW
MKPESCRLSAYLDGELGPADRAQVEAHLAGCPDCAGRMVDLRRQGDVLARAGGGLLLHVDVARLVERQLPERRRSLVMVRTQGVRRRLSLGAFGVALTLALFSFVYPAGPAGALGRMSEPAVTAFFMNWALMAVAGALMVWPEKAAWIEASFWALLRGGRPQVSARERMLVQGVGLAFLVLSTCLHLMLVSGRGLPL